MSRGARATSRRDLEAQCKRQCKGTPSRRQLLLSAATLALWETALAGCESCRSPTEEEPVLYTSIDRGLAEPLLRAFEKRRYLKLRAVYPSEEAGDGAALEPLLGEAEPAAFDVVWSADPLLALQLVARDRVQAYLSPSAVGLPDSARDARGLWTGFAAHARVLLVNEVRVPAAELPTSLQDLINPQWRNNIALSTPLLGNSRLHVGALFSLWGAERTRGFLDALKANGVRFVSSDGEVKRLVASAQVAWGLTSSDEASAALEEGARVQIVYPDQDGIGTLLIPCAVVLMRNAPHPQRARQLIDYLLSAEVERRLADNAARLPLRDGVSAPAHLRSAVGLRAMPIDFAELGRQLEAQQAWLSDHF